MGVPQVSLLYMPKDILTLTLYLCNIGGARWDRNLCKVQIRMSAELGEMISRFWVLVRVAIALGILLRWCSDYSTRTIRTSPSRVSMLEVLVGIIIWILDFSRISTNINPWLVCVARAWVDGRSAICSFSEQVKWRKREYKEVSAGAQTL